MIGKQKYVTIATDISLSADPDYPISTWACYIRTPTGAIKHSAPFMQLPAKYTTAHLETLALANALVIASNNVKLSECIVIIYNEIDYVLRPIKTRHGAPKKSDAVRTRVIEQIMLPTLETCQSWELRDVKAHSPQGRRANAEKKYVLNRWCDKESRRLMKSLRRAQRQSAKDKAKGV